MAEEIKKETTAGKKPSKVKEWFKRNKGKIMLIGGAIGGGVLGIFGIKKLGEAAENGFDLKMHEIQENFLNSCRPVRVLHADGNEEDGWLAPFEDGEDFFLPDTEKSVGRLAGTFDFSEFDWVHDAADKAAEEPEE